MHSQIVHRQIREVEYRAATCSAAYFLRLLLTLIAVLVPIPIIFSSQGLWKKYGEYTEQPVLGFNPKYLIALEGPSETLFATSFSVLEGLPGFLPAWVRHRAQDNNGDGKPDEIALKFTIPIPANASYAHVIYFIFFDMRIDYHDVVEIEVAITDRLASSPTGALRIDSPILIDQLQPLYTPTLDTAPIVDLTRLDLNHYSLPRIASAVAARPLGLRLARPTVTSPLGSSAGSSSLNSSVAPTPPQLTLAFSLNIPQSRIVYQTRFFELIKWAWVQYLAIFVIIYWITEKIAQWLFENRIVHAIIYRID